MPVGDRDRTAVRSSNRAIEHRPHQHEQSERRAGTLNASERNLIDPTESGLLGSPCDSQRMKNAITDDRGAPDQGDDETG